MRVITAAELQPHNEIKQSDIIAGTNANKFQIFRNFVLS